MRTTLNIPTELLEDARHALGDKTKTETIIIALKELIRQKKVDKLISQAGTLDFDEAHDARHQR